MKRVLFCINNMKMGGIQKSLVELLNAICDNYEITLFCINPAGELMADIPDKVSVISAPDTLKASDLTLSEARTVGIKCALAKILGSFISRRWNRSVPARIITKGLKKTLGLYDVAISFSQPVEEHKFYMLANEVVINGCDAKQKITWVHCDYKNYGGDSPLNRELYRKFDCIAACSDSVGNRLCEVIPDVRSKVFTVYNCHDYENICYLANDNPVQYKKTTVVSVSRLTEEKGLLRAIDAIHVLVSQGFDFQWYIIGDGPLKAELMKKTNELSLQDTVIFCGQQTNPYRFMKNANLFFLPSFHEAAPMVFEEAKTLGVPVLSTNTLSAEELVAKQKIGWICENTEQGIVDGLIRALNSIKDGMIKIDAECNNELAIAQFNRMLEGDEKVWN